MGLFSMIKQSFAAEKEWKKLKKSLSETHFDYEYKVVGVTFKNDDGTKRQEVLADIDDEMCNRFQQLSFEEYDYKGEPAMSVLYLGEQIGNIEAHRVSAFKKKLKNAEYAFISTGCFDANEYEDTKREKLIYFANVTLWLPRKQ